MMKIPLQAGGVVSRPIGKIGLVVEVARQVVVEGGHERPRDAGVGGVVFRRLAGRVDIRSSETVVIAA